MSPPTRSIRLKVASPCTVPWDSMTGDDAVRFCGTCEKQVYNLTGMSTDQVEALLASPAGRPCVRFFQRADGTILTADCPVGARRVRRRRLAAGLGAGILTALGVALGADDAPRARSLPYTMVEEPRPLMGVPAPVEVRGEPAAVEVRGEPAAVEIMGELPPYEEFQGDVHVVERPPR